VMVAVRQDGYALRHASPALIGGPSCPV